MKIFYKADRCIYSCKQIFSLVADINLYSDFIPTCYRSQIISKISAADGKENKLRARLAFKKGKFNISLITENICYPSNKIKINLVRGDMRHLEGEWLFTPSDGGCLIEFNCKYEIKNPLLGFLMNNFIDDIWQTLIKRFMQRAEEIYGKK